MNMKTMEFYAAGLCGLMGLFIFLHLTRVFAQKSGFNKATIFAPFHYVSRWVSIVSPAPGFGESLWLQISLEGSVSPED